MSISVAEQERLSDKLGEIKPYLDERQWRLLLGAEARALGRGGRGLVARLAHASPDTVTRGMRELEQQITPTTGKVGNKGAGRPAAEQVDPQLKPALEALVDPGTRGDPESPLRWMTTSTTKLAEELTAAGHPVSADTVGRLLKDEGYSLQAGAKTIEGHQHPDRDGQFRYINKQVKDYQASGDPVISVDTKKKELVGLFKNGGRQGRPAGNPERVNVHDFVDPALGKAIPYGVYDVAANTGWVNVGTDAEAAQFAVESIRRWWLKAGQQTYPRARRLLITADSGGSNGSRLRLWKVELANLAAETGLQITVCHLPPGTSKWNKVEHRLFSAISMNWRGRPLTSHEVIVQTIVATTTTTTTTGLTVHAELDTGTHPTGIKISDKQMKDLTARAVIRHDYHGDWNYTLPPTTNTPDMT